MLSIGECKMRMTDELAGMVLLKDCKSPLWGLRCFKTTTSMVRDDGVSRRLGRPAGPPGRQKCASPLSEALVKAEAVASRYMY